MSNKPELELKHILPYLPYKLKCNEKWTLISLSSFEDSAMFDYSARFDGENKKGYIQFLKPMLRPMSDLFKNITHNGISVCVGGDILQDMNKLVIGGEPYRESYLKNLNLKYLEFWAIEMLFKYHFDVFGLIEKGLAEPIKNK
jgi:hypothetical protein